MLKIRIIKIWTNCLFHSFLVMWFGYLELCQFVVYWQEPAPSAVINCGVQLQIRIKKMGVVLKISLNAYFSYDFFFMDIILPLKESSSNSGQRDMLLLNFLQRERQHWWVEINDFTVSVEETKYPIKLLDTFIMQQFTQPSLYLIIS